MMNWRSDPKVGLKALVDQRCSASAGGRKGRFIKQGLMDHLKPDAGPDWRFYCVGNYGYGIPYHTLAWEFLRALFPNHHSVRV